LTLPALACGRSERAFGGCFFAVCRQALLNGRRSARRDALSQSTIHLA
jgi:hypothetical protein